MRAATATATPSSVSSGPMLGFSTLAQETVVDELPLQGVLPQWLAGSLLRTGPAKFEVGKDRMRHWFDG
ncbi:MAG TPA: carotenoid oxygenase family protein, partial [Solirubrobacteraceae bacterium]|nr:carotenoid oxygenase family protein [Solirubrobacteraceae bacterium]